MIQEHAVKIIEKKDWFTYKDFEELSKIYIEKALQAFVQSPLDIIEYMKKGGFNNVQDEKTNRHIHQNRLNLLPKLKESFSVQKLNENFYGIVFDVAHMLDGKVPDEKDVQGKFLQDYTKEENAHYQISEAWSEIFKNITTTMIEDNMDYLTKKKIPPVDSFEQWTDLMFESPIVCSQGGLKNVVQKYQTEKYIHKNFKP